MTLHIPHHEKKAPKGLFSTNPVKDQFVTMYWMIAVMLSPGVAVPAFRTVAEMYSHWFDASSDAENV